MADRHALDTKFRQISLEAQQPESGGFHTDIGEITEVLDNGQVRVSRYIDGGGKEDIGPHPIVGDVSTLEDIQSRFGKLVPGMGIIIFWRGRHSPQKGKTWIQVISKGSLTDRTILEKELPVNELSTGPAFIFSGGLLPG